VAAVVAKSVAKTTPNVANRGWSVCFCPVASSIIELQRGRAGTLNTANQLEVN